MRSPSRASRIVSRLANDSSSESVRSREVAQRMGHTTAAATGLVDRLEKLGLARRAHARDDRRKVLVQPTAEGSALVTSVRDDMIDNLLELMAALEPDEQRAWVRIYEKI